MNREDVRKRLETALEALVQNDGYMLEIAVAERALVARLSQYLMPLFPDYAIDTDYDRHGMETKRAEIPSECATKIDEAGKAIIIPDLIVHRRGNDNYNLLVVEAKKSSDRRGSNCDRLRVNALKRELGYQFAALITFPVRRVPLEPPVVEWL